MIHIWHYTNERSSAWRYIQRHKKSLHRLLGQGLVEFFILIFVVEQYFVTVTVTVTMTMTVTVTVTVTLHLLAECDGPPAMYDVTHTDIHIGASQWVKPALLCSPALNNVLYVHHTCVCTHAQTHTCTHTDKCKTLRHIRLLHLP
jgi:hypothetical protein